MSDIEPTSTRAFSILVCFDYTDASGYAFEQAARLAKRIASSQIHLLYVMSGDASAERAKQEAGQLEAYVNAKAASIGGMDGQSFGLHIRHGDPLPEIAQLAAEIDVDLIVVGSPRHPHLKSLLLGAIAEKLYQHAPCPVLVAGPKPVEPRVHFPAIQAPCPDCVEARVSSGGAEWWCARHGHGHRGASGHVYSYQREIPFAVHDSEVSPTGIDF